MLARPEVMLPMADSPLVEAGVNAFSAEQGLVQTMASEVSTSTVGLVTAAIADDVEPPELTLFLTGNPLVESGGSATITARLSAVSRKDLIVALQFGGAAVHLADFTCSATTIMIPAGSTEGSVTLTALHDLLDEADETIEVGIGLVGIIEPGSGVKSAAVDSGVAAAAAVTAIIVDDDPPPSVTLSVDRSTIPERPYWGTTGFNSFSGPEWAVVTATLSAPSSFDVTVQLAFSGTATPSADYTPSATSLVIPAGSTTGSVTLTVVLDIIDEPDESIAIEIGSATNAYEATPQQVTSMISDDDLPPHVKLSSSGSSMLELRGTVIVTVTLWTYQTPAGWLVVGGGPRAAISGFDVIVQLAFAGTATNGIDYTASATSVVIPAGESSASITLSAVQDLLYEPDESITVEISSMTNALHLILVWPDGSESGRQTVTATIVDAESNRPPAESFIGRHIDDVGREVYGGGYICRILKLDGVGQFHFADIQDHRLNVSVEQGIVTEAFWESGDGGFVPIRLVLDPFKGGVPMVLNSSVELDVAITAGIDTAIDIVDNGSRQASAATVNKAVADLPVTETGPAVYGGSVFLPGNDVLNPHVGGEFDSVSHVRDLGGVDTVATNPLEPLISDKQLFIRAAAIGFEEPAAAKLAAIDRFWSDLLADAELPDQVWEMARARRVLMDHDAIGPGPSIHANLSDGDEFFIASERANEHLRAARRTELMSVALHRLGEELSFEHWNASDQLL